MGDWWNTAIFSPAGTSAGIGFAVPVEKLRRVLPDLIDLGYYRRPWLGIRYAYHLTSGLANILRLPVDHGLLLLQVYDDAPLAIGGVRGSQREAILGSRRYYVDGDILIAINNYEITSLTQREGHLEDSHSIGEEVTLKIFRDGKQIDARVKLAESPT